MQLDNYEVLYKNTIDDTGTVSTVSLINPDAEFKEQYLYKKIVAEQREMEEIKGVIDEVLKLYGIATGKKV